MKIFNKKLKGEIMSPVVGTVVQLENIDDPVFSKKLMGDGLGIIPADGEVLSPISGKMEVVFPTQHAFVVKNEAGVSVLIHVGLDTVNLNGKGFKAQVKANETVKVGQPLVSVDWAYLRKHAKSPVVVVLVTPESTKKAAEILTSGSVKTTSTIIKY